MDVGQNGRPRGPQMLVWFSINHPIIGVPNFDPYPCIRRTYYDPSAFPQSKPTQRLSLVDGKFTSLITDSKVDKGAFQQLTVSLDSLAEAKGVAEIPDLTRFCFFFFLAVVCSVVFPSWCAYHLGNPKGMRVFCYVFGFFLPFEADLQGYLGRVFC